MNFDAQRKVAGALPGATGVIPATHLARAKWVQVGPGHALGSTALNQLVRHSHALVLARLSNELQREPNP